MSFSDSDDNIDSDDSVIIDWYNRKLLQISNKQTLYECDANQVINNTTVWKKQRLLEEERVIELIDYQLEQRKKRNRWMFVEIFMYVV